MSLSSWTFGWFIGRVSYYTFIYPINITAVYLFFGLSKFKRIIQQLVKLFENSTLEFWCDKFCEYWWIATKNKLPFKNSEETPYKWDLLKESNQNSGQRTLELFLASQGYSKIGLNIDNSQSYFVVPELVGKKSDFCRQIIARDHSYIT